MFLKKAKRGKVAFSRLFYFDREILVLWWYPSCFLKPSRIKKRSLFFSVGLLLMQRNATLDFTVWTKYAELLSEKVCLYKQQRSRLFWKGTTFLMAQCKSHPAFFCIKYRIFGRSSLLSHTPEVVLELKVLFVCWLKLCAAKKNEAFANIFLFMTVFGQKASAPFTYTCSFPLNTCICYEKYQRTILNKLPTFFSISLRIITIIMIMVNPLMGKMEFCLEYEGLCCL